MAQQRIAKLGLRGLKKKRRPSKGQLNRVAGRQLRRLIPPAESLFKLGRFTGKWKLVNGYKVRIVIEEP